jgi:hypothetical protein
MVIKDWRMANHKAAFSQQMRELLDSYHVIAALYVRHQAASAAVSC